MKYQAQKKKIITITDPLTAPSRLCSSLKDDEGVEAFVEERRSHQDVQEHADAAIRDGEDCPHHLPGVLPDR